MSVRPKMLPVPFLGPFQRPISSGVIVRISGTTLPGANIFNVNLQCGASVNPRDDVAFHMSINFNSFTIIANSIMGNQWGPPEQCNGHQFPIQQGREFCIEITCEQSAFQVNINGISSARFEHRVEPSRINHLAIDGDVILWNVECIEGTKVPMGVATPPHELNPAGMPPMPPYHPSMISCHSSGNVGPPMHPAGWLLYQAQPTAPYNQQSGPYPQLPLPYPQQQALYHQQPAVYPGHPGPYAQQPELYPQQPGPYTHQKAPNPQQLGSVLSQTQQQDPGTPARLAPSSSQPRHKKSLLDMVNFGGIGSVVGSAAAASAVLGKKGAKKLEKLAEKASKKAHKKALKYGLPFAGASLGTYAIKKSSHRSGHSSSSSSD